LTSPVPNAEAGLSRASSFPSPGLVGNQESENPIGLSIKKEAGVVEGEEARAKSSKDPSIGEASREQLLQLHQQQIAQLQEDGKKMAEQYKKLQQQLVQQKNTAKKKETQLRMDLAKLESDLVRMHKLVLARFPTASSH
jgi:hypothetical protein